MYEWNVMVDGSPLLPGHAMTSWMPSLESSIQDFKIDVVTRDCSNEIQMLLQSSTSMSTNSENTILPIINSESELMIIDIIQVEANLFVSISELISSYI